MKNKGEVFEKIVEFKALVENGTGEKISSLRSDNGGKIVSNDFKEFYAKGRIRIELIVPHNPQRNGVAKRKNISIVGVAREMLHDQGMPLYLWA